MNVQQRFFFKILYRTEVSSWFINYYVLNTYNCTQSNCGCKIVDCCDSLADDLSVVPMSLESCNLSLTIKITYINYEYICRAT